MTQNSLPEHGPDATIGQSGSTTEGVGIAPSLGPVLYREGIGAHATLLGPRVYLVSLLAMLLGGIGFAAAWVLIKLIGLLTNICFYGRISCAFSGPTDQYLGIWIIAVPVAGALIVGMMARFGSAAIRGHGIPEAMESILLKGSSIPARLTWLKPLSAAISIGTGGPFGAEGPIIATGGAFGSLLGKFFGSTPDERKVLLAAGAAAGMSATFGSPVAAVLLAVELLLFEFRPRSIIPVAIASSAAAGLRLLVFGSQPVFPMTSFSAPGPGALLVYAAIGIAAGVLAAGVSRAVYVVEDGFEKHCRLHWMWWPAIAAVAVGVCGYMDPQVLGVGYNHIDRVLSGTMAVGGLCTLLMLKWFAWTVSLGSGTSGGTLAPLFTIGSCAGALLGSAAVYLLPHAGVNVRVAALVGMAALFTGASRAILTSIVFAFETTLQPHGLLPLLAGCTMAFMVSCLLMRDTIMTEKIARRGIRVSGEFTIDFLDRLFVRDAANFQPVCLSADKTVAEIHREILNDRSGPHHHGFPVIDSTGDLLGFLTTRELLRPGLSATTRIGDVIDQPAVTIYPECPLRVADELMARHKIGRLVVVEKRQPKRVVGIISRADLLSAHRRSR